MARARHYCRGRGGTSSHRSEACLRCEGRRRVCSTSTVLPYNKRSPPKTTGMDRPRTSSRTRADLRWRCKPRWIASGTSHRGCSKRRELGTESRYRVDRARRRVRSASSTGRVRPRRTSLRYNRARRSRHHRLLRYRLRPASLYRRRHETYRRRRPRTSTHRTYRSGRTYRECARLLDPKTPRRYGRRDWGGSRTSVSRHGLGRYRSPCRSRHPPRLRRPPQTVSSGRFAPVGCCTHLSTAESKRRAR